MAGVMTAPALRCFDTEQLPVARLFNCVCPHCGELHMIPMDRMLQAAVYTASGIRKLDGSEVRCSECGRTYVRKDCWRPRVQCERVS